jgi:hypothetical protein
MLAVGAGRPCCFMAIAGNDALISSMRAAMFVLGSLFGNDGSRFGDRVGYDVFLIGSIFPQSVPSIQSECNLI